jgi:hypothetical protein
MTRLALLRACLAAALVALPACGGDDDNGPTTPADYVGTWVGDYTVSLQPGTTYQGVMTVAQSGNAVTGTLGTDAGRTADVTGTVSGTRLTGRFTYTDGCDGSATFSATISSGGTQVDGTYQSVDCLGTYSGAFSLTKQ